MKSLIFIAALCLTSFGITAQSSVESSTDKIQRINSIQFSGLFGSSKTGVGFKYKSLYQIKELMNVGWGIGIDSYNSGLKRNFLPISIEFVGDIFQNGHTPFYMLSAGYGVSLGEDDDFAENSRGGLMMDFSIGFRSKKHDSQPFISVGYRLQNAFYSGEDDYGNVDKDVIYKRWNVSAGMIF